jgi:tetratricopeptide (TPR) repeat protein
MKVLGNSLFVAASAAIVFSAQGAGTPTPADPRPIEVLIDAACGVARADLYRGFPGEGLVVIEALLPLGTRPDATPLDRARLAIARGELEHYRASLAGTSQEKAEQLLRAALAAAEASRNDPAIAEAADLLGLALYSEAFGNGDFAAPVEPLERALAIRRCINDRRGIAETLFHLGLVHQNRAGAAATDRSRALELYREALPIAREGGFEVEQSYLERHIAAEDELRGDLDAALAGFSRSASLRRKTKYQIYLAPALLALGDVHAARGETKEAGSSYREALAVAREARAVRFIVRSHLALARLAEKAGDRDTAVAEAKSALEAARAGGYGDGIKDAEAFIEELVRRPGAVGRRRRRSSTTSSRRS